MPRPPTGPPFPGANPTPSGTPARAAVVGRYAKIQIDSTGVRPVASLADIVLLFDWEVTPNFDYADATAHGDRWKQKVFMDADWTARARGYVVPVSATTYISAATASGGPVLLRFVGYSDMTATTILWAGDCYIARGRISAPMGMMEQEFEMVSSGAPVNGSAFT